MRRRKSFIGALGAILLVLALLSLPVDIVEFEVWRASRDRQLATAPVPGGDPRRFDPLAGYAVARELAGAGAELDSISIELVRADGTMDLLADLPTRPTTTYEFWRPALPPATPLPIGAGGSLSGAWHERVTVTAQRPNSTPALFYGFTAGLNRWSPYSRAAEIVNKGLVRQVDRPQADRTSAAAAPPVCPPARLWQVAIARGAPPDALARVHYGAGGYRFEIRGTPISLAFDADCRPAG
jgi:hypothetical protein